MEAGTSPSGQLEAFSERTLGRAWGESLSLEKKNCWDSDEIGQKEKKKSETIVLENYHFRYNESLKLHQYIQDHR